MQTLTAGKVTLNNATPTQVSTLFANLPFRNAARKLTIRASDTQTGNVLVGLAGLTAAGVNSLGPVSKQASGGGQTDLFEIGTDEEDQVILTDYWLISVAATDTVYVFCTVE